MLTEAQIPTLASAIAAETDPAFVALRDAGATGQMADWFNEDSSTWVWRKSVEADEYRSAIMWSEVDGLQAGKARIWEWITAGMTLPLDATDANVRQGLADCWAANSSTRPALVAIAKRLATRGEALFTSGVGTEANPGVSEIYGFISNADIVRALAV